MRWWQVLVVGIAVLGLWAQGTMVTLRDFWVRPAGKAIPSAAYGVVHNGGAQPDTLLEATSPQAARVELHETVRDTAGRMQMRKVERVVVPARDSVVLRPGGLHIMLYELQQALRPGDTLQLRLRFARAGWQEVRCVVGRPLQPRQRKAPAREEPHEHRH